MKISYDPKYDVMYLKLIDGKAVDTIEVEKNVLIDYGDQGETIGIEIINASGQTKINPRRDGGEVELMLTKKISEKTFGLFKLDHDTIEEIIEDTEYRSW